LSGTNPTGNQVEICGKLIELDALRHTPAGIPVLKFKLGHESTQLEAGIARKVACEIEGIAFEREARLLATAAPGLELRLQGFLDRKSRNSSKLVLHATQIEFENK
jgi:primosomal replication protein N